MASRSKRQKFKALILKPFSMKKDKAVSNDDQSDKPTTSLTAASFDVAADESLPSTSTPNVLVSGSSQQAPGIHTSLTGGIFTHASNFAVKDSIMMDNVVNSTVNVYGASDRRKAMERLFEHIIRGAAHDASAREPPPKCHPGTRIKINEHIITWFYDKEKEELLIWVYGPAGVGKSAIMQTLAEKLTESGHLGASVFISRPNRRNDSRKLIITIAYQLAVIIENYCTFIADKLDRDPDLVNKGMEEQFKAFIVEPFVWKKIGAGAGPWAILLDGLDELDEHHPQRKIIRLIADFVHEHTDVPLLWAIASRPEPQISDTFNEAKVVPTYWKQYVPANSEESRRDVAIFLRASLERIQKEFPRSVPKQWPSEEQFSCLAAAASGLFAFADTAVRFIEDPRYANPDKRLRQVLSALNDLTTTSDSQPFGSLDALYTSILSLIPSEVWSTTKRVVGALLYVQGRDLRLVLRRLGPLSVVLGLDLGDIYASVHGCYSLLNVSNSEHPDQQVVNLYHASFSDYLLDSSRSKIFYICIGGVEDDLMRSSLKIWQHFKTSYPPTSGLKYETRWFKYFSELMPFSPDGRDIACDLMSYIHDMLFIFLVENHDPNHERPFASEEDQHQCFDLLSQLEDSTICDVFGGLNESPSFLLWLFDMWELYQEELVSNGTVYKVELEQVQFSHLGRCPAQVFMMQGKSTLFQEEYEMAYFGNLLRHISLLESRFPRLPVLACGHLGNSCLIFRHEADSSDIYHHHIHPSISPNTIPIWRYFVIPHSQSNFYYDTEHFLRVKFEVIRTSNPKLTQNTWPSKTDFLKLASFASHQPVFADTAIRFIEDPDFHDSITRLDQILSLVDEVDVSRNQPFIYVDALYTHILNSVPQDIWPITQQVLGALYHGLSYNSEFFISPRGISIVLGIELSVVYTALRGFYPMVKIPPENFSWKSMAFLHPSFCEYLIDQTRSRIFYISMENAKNNIWSLLINIWQDFRKLTSGSSEYYPKWESYCSRYHSGTNSSDDPLILDFDHDLFHCIHDALFSSIKQYSTGRLGSEQHQDQIFYMLGQLDLTTICIRFRRWKGREFAIWLFDIWDAYEAELTNQGLIHESEFQELQLDYSYGCLSSHTLHCKVGESWRMSPGVQPTSQDEHEKYISGLLLFQQRRPQLRVLIGGSPGDKFAVFEYKYTEDDLKERMHGPLYGSWSSEDVGYYILPYHDKV